MIAPRPFRFGVVGGDATWRAAWVDLARKAEALGYSSLVIGEHIDFFMEAPQRSATCGILSYTIPPSTGRPYPSNTLDHIAQRLMSTQGMTIMMNKKQAQRQRWRFERLVAVAQSAYIDAQGDLATWALQAAWVAAEASTELDAVIASAQFMLDHPIDDIDEAILRDLIYDSSHMEITLSA